MYVDTKNPSLLETDLDDCDKIIRIYMLYATLISYHETLLQQPHCDI